MTIDDHHGGKRVMESSEIVPFKQPEPTVVQRPCDPRITSTSPNQYDMQEAQYESTRVNTLVPNGNNGTVNPYHFGQNAVQLQQAIQEQAELINNLETALRQTKADLRAAKQEVQDQERDLGDLRRKVTENATRTIELPLQLPLHCPEGEIMKAWHNLTYDVENLVSNHFRDSKGGRVVTWAKDKKDHLHNLTPHYTDVVKEKKTSAAFIEAAIWNALCVCVFGPYRNNAPFCWAGKYRGSLRTMSNFLLADIDALKSDGYRNRHKAMFHQWKTLTANLVATIVPQGRHNDEKAEIAHDLGDMLDGLPSPRPTQERIADLQGIVDKAVDLAMRLCGQKTWYCVAWYPEKCREVPLDEERMELMVGSPRSKRVRFMVRPGINGSRGEDYENMWLLERCRCCGRYCVILS
ncbi:hypothetical protein CEP53_000244 [Fusarium sp. AF-6]|nr:hypothetical protein CEP53_000244 [Fusarium sp. AF-6]